jgi:phosphoribosylglycinamide formyltransferase 1
MQETQGIIEMNFAFFASHTGTNMQAVMDACKTGHLLGKPCVVISNNSDAEASPGQKVIAFHTIT